MLSTAVPVQVWAHRPAIALSWLRTLEEMHVNGLLDARLRAAWDLEERARASGLPTLVLRLAPVLGEDEPMWHRLASRPRLGRRARRPLQPVLKDDLLARGVPMRPYLD